MKDKVVLYIHGKGGSADETEHYRDLTSQETMSEFAKSIGATLTIMEGSKHWFHTGKQMAFLDNWIMQKS